MFDRHFSVFNPDGLSARESLESLFGAAAGRWRIGADGWNASFLEAWTAGKAHHPGATLGELFPI